MIKYIIIILTLFFFQTAKASEILGFPKVVDGDTIHIKSYKIRLEGIRFLSRVEIELEDSGDLNLPKQNQAQNLDHQSPESALNPARQEESSSKDQGNRRLRRAEAKMARKNARKK